MEDDFCDYASEFVEMIDGFEHLCQEKNIEPCIAMKRLIEGFMATNGGIIMTDKEMRVGQFIKQG